MTPLDVAETLLSCDHELAVSLRRSTSSTSVECRWCVVCGSLLVGRVPIRPTMLVEAAEALRASLMPHMPPTSGRVVRPYPQQPLEEILSGKCAGCRAQLLATGDPPGGNWTCDRCNVPGATVAGRLVTSHGRCPVSRRKRVIMGQGAMHRAKSNCTCVTMVGRDWPVQTWGLAPGWPGWLRVGVNDNARSLAEAAEDARLARICRELGE